MSKPKNGRAPYVSKGQRRSVSKSNRTTRSNIDRALDKQKALKTGHPVYIREWDGASFVNVLHKPARGERK